MDTGGNKVPGENYCFSQTEGIGDQWIGLLEQMRHKRDFHILGWKLG